MAEVKIGQYPPGSISRRDFLKLLKRGSEIVAAVVAADMLSSCGIKAPEDTGFVEFREVADGQTVNLVLPGEINRVPVVIEYPHHGNDFTPLQIRPDNKGNDTVEPFTPGKLMTRKMGELTSWQIYKVKANPELKDEKTGEPIDIHMYPSAVTDSGSATGIPMDRRQTYDALIVITAPKDYMKNGPTPLELNGHKFGPNPVECFGIGAWLGGISTENGKTTFHGGKFIHDLRAVVSAK